MSSLKLYNRCTEATIKTWTNREQYMKSRLQEKRRDKIFQQFKAN